MRNEVNEKPHLIYDKTTKKLKLQINGLRDGSTNETSITLLNSFNGKRVMFWLTKKGTWGDLTVKASVSNYSGTLTLSSALDLRVTTHLEYPQKMQQSIKLCILQTFTTWILTNFIQYWCKKNRTEMNRNEQICIYNVSENISRSQLINRTF